MMRWLYSILAGILALLCPLAYAIGHSTRGRPEALALSTALLMCLSGPLLVGGLYFLVRSLKSFLAGEVSINSTGLMAIGIALAWISLQLMIPELLGAFCT